LLGPIFIPFFIVPHLDWLFWGWLKSLIQYAFYPVVANAYLFVFGNLLIHFLDAHPAPYDGATLMVMFLPLMMLLISFTFPWRQPSDRVSLGRAKADSPSPRDGSKHPVSEIGSRTIP